MLKSIYKLLLNSVFIFRSYRDYLYVILKHIADQTINLKPKFNLPTDKCFYTYRIRHHRDQQILKRP